MGRTCGVRVCGDGVEVAGEEYLGLGLGVA